ncbi:MAG: hypothetical protein LBK70_03545 [Clostridiales bacterium]|jgi:hypothetical protein|nr:hypothetical protein [Clostridiales bacterium]
MPTNKYTKHKSTQWLLISIVFFVFVVMSFLIGIVLIDYTNNNVYYTLKIPQLVLNNTSQNIIWQPIYRASGYQLMIDGQKIGYLPPEQCIFDTKQLYNGTHTVAVQAIGINNVVDSNWSNSLYFDVSDSIDGILDIPTHLQVNDGILSWQKVEHAHSYVIKIEDVAVLISNEHFVDISYLPLGQYNIQIKSIA